MSTFQSLHVALTFDDYFWAPAYATMRSVCLATRRRRDLVFHLFHWRLADAHYGELDAIATEFGATLIHYALDADPRIADLLPTLPGGRGFPPVIYARLLLADLLPPEIERFLYLDCDLYVRAPVEKLIEMDLAGNAFAAAPEPGRHHLVNGDDMKTRLGPFDSADPYFNSGVMMIDRRKWAAAALPDFLDHLQETGDLKTLFYDQDLLNLKFAGNWLPLDPRWNLTKPHPALRALDPFIVHYTTAMKPWNAIAYVAFGSSYRHVMTRGVLSRYAAYRRRIWVQRLFGRGPR